MKRFCKEFPNLTRNAVSDIVCMKEDSFMVASVAEQDSETLKLVEGPRTKDMPRELNLQFEQS